MKKIIILVFVLLTVFFSTAYSENDLTIQGTYRCTIQTINKVENYLTEKLSNDMKGPVLDDTDEINREALNKIDEKDREKVQDQLKVLYHDGHKNAQKDIKRIVQSMKMLRLTFENNNRVVLNGQNKESGRKYQETGTYSHAENLVTVQWPHSIEQFTILDAGTNISLAYMNEFPFPLLFEKVK